MFPRIAFRTICAEIASRGVAGLVLALFAAALLQNGCLLMRQRGQYFDAGGVRIHYTDEGEGMPVVLVHGFAVNADLNWRDPGIIDALTPHYRVIAFDNRGHGLSDNPRGPGAYGIQMAEDVVRLMNHLDVERAHVVGYSMGGFVTLKLLEAHPERLITAAPCGAGWERAEGSSMQELEGVVGALEERGSYAPLLRKLAPEDNPVPWWKVLAVDLFFRLTNDEEVMASVLDSLPELEVSAETLENCRVPVLSIVGGADRFAEGAERLHEVLPGHELVVVPGASHFSTLYSPLFEQSLLDFLRTTSASKVLPK